MKVDWEARHPETFYDLSLDVKGCKNVYESLKKYCEQQTLTGSNQVDTKTLGMQDAIMGAQFDSMPPVLNLQLKRTIYDFQRDMMVKVNDYYEFPDILELDNFMSPRAERKVPQRYIVCCCYKMLVIADQCSATFRAGTFRRSLSWTLCCVYTCKSW